MGNERVETAILDAAPLIHLDQINHLSLLSIFNNLIIPREVYEEVSVGEIPSELEQYEYEVVEAENKKVFEKLDEGESSALSIAQDMGDEIVFLTDDLDARQKAKDLGIEVHGSIGVIAANFRNGNLEFEEAVTAMRSLQTETELFVTDAVVEQGIKLLEEYSR